VDLLATATGADEDSGTIRSSLELLPLILN
jgi:hypothetical protein